MNLNIHKLKNIPHSKNSTIKKGMKKLVLFSIPTFKVKKIITQSGTAPDNPIS